ncbi:MAG TPA: radical SAM protein [Methanoregulaceae archaeon]|nr:radical SAM protein [Methanoregulaceae archaeon]HPD75692.1 radical SAM protein [Methanoregulaceae archaeon]
MLASSQETTSTMTPVVREVRAKSILTRSQIYPYVINPYTGCQHGCSYCYARFMKRVTGHREPWGEFVDVKANAPELLRKEVLQKKRDRVWVSGVCDPYQPLEAKYRLTRQCLAILADNHWPVTIQTRSPLVLRDIDIIRNAQEFEAGFSIGTADDAIRRLFEPSAPPISERIAALETLHAAGIRTYAMIAPVLPGAQGLAAQLAGKVDFIVIDRMNYHYADHIYREHGLEEFLSERYYEQVRRELAAR